MRPALQPHIHRPAGPLGHLPHALHGPGQAARPRQSRAQVAIAGPRHRQVHGEDQGRAPRLPRPGQQVAHEAPVPQDIELEPEGLRRRRRHLGNGTDAHGGQGEGNAGRLRRPGGLHLSAPRIHAGKPHRGQRHRQGQGLPEQLGLQIDGGHVPQDPLADLQILQVRHVPAQGCLGVAAAVEIVEQEPGHPPAGNGAIVGDGGGLHSGLLIRHCGGSSAVRPSGNRDDDPQTETRVQGP